MQIQRLLKPLQTIEMPLVRVLASMESLGIAIDENALDREMCAPLYPASARPKPQASSALPYTLYLYPILYPILYLIPYTQKPQGCPAFLGAEPPRPVRAALFAAASCFAADL